MRGSSAFYFMRGMHSRDLITKREIADATWKQFKFVMSGSEDMEDVAAATEAGLSFIKDKSEADLREAAEAVYDELMVDKFWPGTVALARAHLQQGHRVWLVSATAQEIADVIAARIGLTGALATKSEVVDGVYTGKLAGRPMHGPTKAEAVAEIARERGVNLALSYAYSDSVNDLPMLSMVGHPVAVNPDARLRAHASEAGWPVRDYRARSTTAVKVGVPAGAAALAGFGAGLLVGLAARRGGTV